MNEPNAMPTEQWLTVANTAIEAIRDVGATNLILLRCRRSSLEVHRPPADGLVGTLPLTKKLKEFWTGF